MPPSCYCKPRLLKAGVKLTDYGLAHSFQVTCMNDESKRAHLNGIQPRLVFSSPNPSPRFYPEATTMQTLPVLQSQWLNDIWSRATRRNPTICVSSSPACARSRWIPPPAIDADRDRIRYRLPLYRQLTFHVERRRPQQSSASRPQPLSNRPRSCNPAATANPRLSSR